MHAHVYICVRALAHATTYIVDVRTHTDIGERAHTLDHPRKCTQRSGERSVCIPPYTYQHISIYNHRHISHAPRSETGVKDKQTEGHIAIRTHAPFTIL